MHHVDIKPLSVNEAWKGRRFKTDKYKRYERSLLYMLPKVVLPDPPYSCVYEFGFSNSLSDLDNPVKLFQDILQKKYGFNDRDVIKLELHKRLVPKGKEYIRFKIMHAG